MMAPEPVVSISLANVPSNFVLNSFKSFWQFTSSPPSSSSELWILLFPYVALNQLNNVAMGVQKQFQAPLYFRFWARKVDSVKVTEITLFEAESSEGIQLFGAGFSLGGNVCKSVKHKRGSSFASSFDLLLPQEIGKAKYYAWKKNWKHNSIRN